MTRQHEITADVVRLIYDYDPQTGFLTHRRGRGRAKRNSRAGTVKKNGYRTIRVRGRWFSSGRVAWLHYYGEWPRHQIDHINHVRDDDRIANLRDVPGAVNMHNLGALRSNSTTGVVGVSFNKRQRKYVASVYVGGRCIFLGQFSSLPEAAEARAKGKAQYHASSHQIQ